MSDDACLTIRPGVAVGAPCVGRTGAPAWAVAGPVWAGDSLEETARDYNCTRNDALVACWFLATYGIESAWWNGAKRHAPGRVWVKRWGAWAAEHAEAFWRHQYDRIPDPPSREAADE